VRDRDRDGEIKKHEMRVTERERAPHAVRDRDRDGEIEKHEMRVTERERAVWGKGKRRE
jgi:hypothetical protein